MIMEHTDLKFVKAIVSDNGWNTESIEMPLSFKLICDIRS